jgi:tetratricopeptide (TPR) repeat protein
MKSAIGWVGFLVVAASTQLACEEPSSSGRAGGSAPSGSGARAASNAPSASSAATSAPAATPKPEEKKLITVTTKSPEAKAAFMKGWELWDSGRGPEALAACKDAVAADADFALAQTCVGWFTPGAAGQAICDKAAELAAKLPEAERLLIEGIAGVRHADFAKYDANMKKLAEVAPDDFRAHVWAARPAYQHLDLTGAEAACKKALALNPRASSAYALLVTVQTELKKYDDALVSAQTYVETSPSEPSARRALGGALLNVGKTTEAEAALVKAVELGPKVLGAYDDLAIVRTILGNFAGARDALDKAKVAAVEPGDAIDRRANAAWVSFAEGKDADALATLDAAEKDAETQNLPAAWHPATTRASALWILGRAADAVKVADAAIAKCDGRAQSAELEKRNCRGSFMQAKALAQLSLGNVADLQKTVAEYLAEAKRVPDRPRFQRSAEMLSDAALALEKKDAKAAAALLARCPPYDVGWKLAISRLADKLADKTVVEQIKKDLAARPVKAFEYPLVMKVLKK